MRLVTESGSSRPLPPSMRASDFDETVEQTDFRMDISKWVEGSRRGTVTFESRSQDVRVVCVSDAKTVTFEAYGMDSDQPFIELASRSILDGSEERLFLHMRDTVGLLYSGLVQFSDECDRIFERNGTALLGCTDELVRQTRKYLGGVVRELKMAFG